MPNPDDEDIARAFIENRLDKEALKEAFEEALKKAEEARWAVAGAEWLKQHPEALKKAGEARWAGLDEWLKQHPAAEKLAELLSEKAIKQLVDADMQKVWEKGWKQLDVDELVAAAEEAFKAGGAVAAEMFKKLEAGMVKGDKLELEEVEEVKPEFAGRRNSPRRISRPRVRRLRQAVPEEARRERMLVVAFTKGGMKKLADELPPSGMREEIKFAAFLGFELKKLAGEFKRADGLKLAGGLKLADEFKAALRGFEVKESAGELLQSMTSEKSAADEAVVKQLIDLVMEKKTSDMDRRLDMPDPDEDKFVEDLKKLVRHWMQLEQSKSRQKIEDQHRELIKAATEDAFRRLNMPNPYDKENLPDPSEKTEKLEQIASRSIEDEASALRLKALADSLLFGATSTSWRALIQGNIFVRLCRAVSITSGGFLLGSTLSHGSILFSLLGTAVGFVAFAANEAMIRRTRREA